jgi:hypothetical protein
VHDLLARCDAVAALPGEIEPYLRLTGNAQGVDGSNEVTSFTNIEELRALVRTDLRLWSQPLPLVHGSDWHQRRLLFQSPMGLELDEGWYDGCSRPPASNLTVLEEPPLVPIADAVKPGSLNGVKLILKTPQLVYRRGLVEALFPNSPVHYLHLRRSAPGTVNGLLDGWLGPHFWSYRLPAPDGAAMPDWWCFDVPPGWHATRGLLDACVLQWVAANTAALLHPLVGHLHYEDLWRPQAEQRIAAACGIAVEARLRTVMATEQPAERRWATKRPELAGLMERNDVTQLMEQLGYVNGGVQW